ncbi:hypothetical protein DPX39_020020800 [Trypanosoma brucei equiperdum]|uniref:Uncharacterized protein n=1 Tax=Trypanosoma brucei equiperdum TaxID=630700 RepID=A0A3L6LHF8_9TRYP|nr:hypothetical protein DPX39_020020800 [Trypanosoma brucei equiperdum]
MGTTEIKCVTSLEGLMLFSRRFPKDVTAFARNVDKR